MTFDNPSNVLYTGQVFQIVETPVFSDWLGKLRDRRGAANITNRLLRASDGHLGDVESVGDGVFEMRIHVGPGYRVYYYRRGAEVILLLCGGDKDSQRRDISRAKDIKDGIEQSHGDSPL